MRQAARALVVGATGRILLLLTRDPNRPGTDPWREMPGGGLKPGEDAPPHSSGKGVVLIVRLEQARPGQAVNGDDRPDSLTAGQLDGRDTHRRRWPGRTLDVARHPNPPPAAARSIFTHTAVRTHGLSTRTDLEHRSPQDSPDIDPRNAGPAYASSAETTNGTASNPGPDKHTRTRSKRDRTH